MKIKFYIPVVLIIFLVQFTSCKSSKTMASGAANLKLTTKQLVKAHKKTKPNFKTLQSKLKLSYTEGSKKQTHTVSFRMQKDEVIWLSAPFGVLRVKLTPKKVAFYNKLDNTYFEGDFKYLSTLLGIPLDFNKVQNILLGATIYNLDEGSYKVSVFDKNYALQPKLQQDLYEIFYIMSPSSYKLTSQQFSQIEKQQHLQIDYLAYQNVGSQSVPEQVKIIAVQGTDEVVAALEFKAVVLDAALRFPFKIPQGFKKIQL